MDNDLKNFLDIIEPDKIDKYIFAANSSKYPERVFGGQVLAQALNAACRTVDGDRRAHSMHGYFLRPGDPTKQIVYQVDPIRDGKSFATRVVVAKQNGIAIFNTIVSFHKHEVGLDHQFEMPDVPPPEGLETDENYWAKHSKVTMSKALPADFFMIENRPVKRRNHAKPEPVDPIQYNWLKARGPLGDDPVRHQTALAFISDYALLGAALLPHPYTAQSKEIMAASLDHAIWFHRPIKADEYLLYVMDSPINTGGRGFSRGSFYSRDGLLVASTVQESLLRLTPKD